MFEIAVVGVVLAQTVALAWFVRRRTRGLEALQDGMTRLSATIDRFAEALTLLTETAETGFRASAAEIGRLAAPPAGRPAAAERRVANRRVAQQARRGKTVQQIAASERMSEGEVRLRLTFPPEARAKANGSTTSRREQPCQVVPTSR